MNIFSWLIRWGDNTTSEQVFIRTKQPGHFRLLLNKAEEVKHARVTDNNRNNVKFTYSRRKAGKIRRINENKIWDKIE